jgi:hypothetical protein
MRRAPRALVQVAAALLAVAPAAPGAAQDSADPPAAGFELRWAFEAKAHARSSERNRFASPFPFTPDQLPPGQSRAFLETVDGGDHLELSTLTLFVEAARGARLAARAKLDLIDLHDRNPTSTDHEIDLDEAWVRFGPESEPAVLPEQRGAYLRIGKFGKFERQDDRHLESYGLAATAFNRFEDAGVEIGLDLGRHVYLRGSVTQGNPLFLRDPNALAGDNGTPERRRARPDNVPERGSGIVILYDAEVEDLDFDEVELGAGLGVRAGGHAGRWSLDFLAWGYRRELAERLALEGTFYGGDLDLLDGPELPPPYPRGSLPISGSDKQELGANAWLYRGGFSFFGQYVDQEIAGLDRRGFEGEAAWRIELPLVWAAGGRQLLPAVAPAVRYSKLEPEIEGGGPFPAPSVRWEWEKWDVGVRLAIVSGADLTLEYASHRFFIPSLGAHHSNDELLGTVRWKLGS